MIFNPGSLNKKITIQAPPGTTDKYGQQTGDWTDFKLCYAEIKPISGRNFFQGLADQSEITHEVHIRYMAGLKPNMRIKFGTRNFEILYILNLNERNQFMTIYCKELFVNG